MAKELTKKQRGFVKDYLATGNASLAVRKNYDSVSDGTARAMASKNLTKPNIRLAIYDALDKNGLTNEHLAEKVAEAGKCQEEGYIP